MDTLKTLAALTALACGVAVASAPAGGQAPYTVNGQPATFELQSYLAMNGFPPGHYWLDGHGYWGVFGNPNPLGNLYAGNYFAGSGSGEQASNGWSHYNNNAGTWVGGDGNGCIYTPDWSNC